MVLDCEYVYNENDLKLVVKWFFNDGLEPVYQWIPEMKSREAFGVLQGRLDPSFSVNSRDDYSQYRAIRILKPTMELSGRYTCVVASLAGQDARHQDMTVFGKPNVLVPFPLSLFRFFQGVEVHLNYNHVMSPP